MSRQVHHLEQGSEAWHAHRATPNQINGSEIAAIMGLSSYVTRSELIKRKATGIEPEYDAATLKRFADGHENEAKARPLAEAIIDDDLSAMVMSDLIDGVLLSVSLDGITQCYDTTMEHKSLNQALAAALDAGFLPDEYHPQCESGLMVSGATRCLFMASKNGDPDTMRHFWYEPNLELRPRMIAACKQFLEDKANYVHVEATVAPVAAPIESLPALAVTVSGSISLTHNLERFGQRLSAFVGGLNAKPETDQDFADLDAAVKVLKEAEAALDSAEKNALAQTTTIADMCSLVEMYRKVARDNRLMFEKIVKAEKDNRRAEIVRDAGDAMMAHIDKLNQRVGGYVPRVFTPFADAIKGLKSLDSMRDKVAGALAQAKIEANEIADTIEANIKAIPESWKFLFADMAQICTKPGEDFARLAESRITHYQQEEEQRKTYERIAAEAKTAAAVAAAIEAERMAEAKRIADESQQGMTTLVTPDRLRADARAIEAAALTENNQTQFIAPEAKRAAVVEAQDDIAAFMHSREWGKDAGKIRAVLVEFEAFKAGRGLAVAA